MDDKGKADGDYTWPYSEPAAKATGRLAVGSPVLYELVGSVTATGALIEDGLRGIFSWLAAPSREERGPWELVANGQSFTWLADYCVEMGNLRHSDDVWWPGLREAIKTAKTAMEQQRNGVVHAVYAPEADNPDSATWATRSRLKKLTPDRFPATAEDLRGRYRALADAYVQLLVHWIAAIK